MGDWYLAWASYNAGDGKVRRVMKRRSSSDFWRISEGRGLAKETKHYVPKLIAVAILAKNYKAFGFREEDFNFQAPIDFDEVQLADATDLGIIAETAGVTVEEVQELNPELRRWCTPPASATHPYTLKLPRGTRERFTEAFAKIPAQERLTFRIHKVRRGDTLTRIAQTYQSAPEAILRMNALKSARSLKPNTELVVPMPSARAMKPNRAAPERPGVQVQKAGVLAAAAEKELPAATRNRASENGSVRSEIVQGRTKVTYGIQRGDSLWSISQRFGVTVEELKGWNEMGRKKKSLRVGSKLIVWPPARAASLASKD
jgi:membrane-bound lytic murein transglycosylase D